MDDLISRQAAIEAIEHRLAEPAYQHEGEDWYTGMNCAESELYDLPPAQPSVSKTEIVGDVISRQAAIDVKGKRVLDPCCGSRMFWFDKHNKDVVFCDKRQLHTTLYDGRMLDIEPDIICDFTDLPFDDNTFYHVVFDPPHMDTLGTESWMAKKYGTLKGIEWQPMIHDGFWECMRVLKPNGTLIFKWNEQDIPVSKILNVTGAEPMYGHKSGKLQKTHWMAFLKERGVKDG